MITRRDATLVLAGTLLARRASAQPAYPMPAPGRRDWAKALPVVRVGLLGGENDADRLARVDAYQKLLEATFQVPFKLLPAADYAGVIQAFAAGQVDMAYMSPASYAAAWVESKGDVVPLVTSQEQDGTTSYVSVLYVRADSGITSLAEMKGHSLAWADPNSASGYLIPRAEFRAQGINPETYFSRTGFAGGHEQGVVAVLNHQYDAGVTWTSGQGDIAQGYTRGMLRMMVDKKMLAMNDLRIIWKSRPIENGPLTVRKSTPAAFQADMLAFHLALPTAHTRHLPQRRHGIGQRLGAGDACRLPGLRRHAATGSHRTAQAPVTRDRVPPPPRPSPQGGGRRKDSPPPCGEGLGVGGATRRKIARMMPGAARIEAAFRARRRARLRFGLVAGGVFLACLLISAWVSEAYPAALLAGLPRIGEYFAKLVPDLRWPVLFAGTQSEGSFAYWMYRADKWLWLLFETSQMAALATFGGALVAVLLCFPAAANLAPNRAVYIVCRRALELFRGVPDIVYALILVWTFGIGPLAGILAIGLHTIGALGKLFAEVVENADMQPHEAIIAAGGNWAQAVRYAILPQVLPNFLSYALIRFEINVRGATVIGFVGAGGIGQELYSVISFNYYQEVSAIVVLIILAVSLIDLASEALRRRAVGP